MRALQEAEQELGIKGELITRDSYITAVAYGGE